MAKRAIKEVETYKTRLASVEARLSLLTWMMGANIAITLAVVVRVYLEIK